MTRVHGTLTRWNDERGFGFITLAQGRPELFVHISAFPRDGIRPAINELISFEVEDGSDGKQRAMRVQRPQRRPAARPKPAARRLTWAPAALTLAALGIAVAYVLAPVTGSIPAHVGLPDAAPVGQPEPVGFSCDGRKRCSQMSSCDEAKYFLRHCPAQETDGDHDGIPCESQWCN
ncbi:MAG: cold shock domain-containing protein [Pseudomonadota bacterium]